MAATGAWSASPWAEGEDRRLEPGPPPRRWVRQAGHTLLYLDRHPYAGGATSYAMYGEDPDRIKVEVVAPSDD
jgi:hypothetical protein